jgi:hypothetical protein
MFKDVTRILLLAPLLLAALYLCGCQRGRLSEKPPVHIIPDMDSQPRYDTQQLGAFFPDKLAMRSPDCGAVAVGQLRDDLIFYTGKEKDGKYVPVTPLAISLPLLQRGRERFDIYCSPCHSRVGDGKGIVVSRGFVPPPTFHGERLRRVEDGYIFHVISKGYNNMPSYAAQIPVADRWLITAYVRALQRAQNGTLQDVPEELRDQLTQK